MIHISGGKVTLSSTEGIVLINENGIRTIFENSSQCEDLSGSLKLMWNHSEKARNHCLHLEMVLTSVEGNNFPVIIGRRPYTTLQSTDKENFSTNMVTLF